MHQTRDTDSNSGLRFATTPMLAAVVAIAIVALGGCGLLPKVSEPIDLYELTPKTSFDEPLQKVDWQLVVELPTAQAALDTSRIALKRSPFTVEYYANSAWVDNAPAMVQALLIESFERTGAIVAVGREAIGLRPDLILKTDLREFEAIYIENDPIPEVLVRMNVKLVSMPDRLIVASETYESRVKAAGSKFADVITAFDEALGKGFKDIVVFTLNTPAT